MLTKEQEHFYYSSAITSGLRQCICAALYAQSKGINLSTRLMIEILDSVLECEHHKPLAEMKKEIGASVRSCLKEINSSDYDNAIDLFDALQFTSLSDQKEPNPRDFFVNASNEQQFQVIGFITMIAYKIERINQLVGINTEPNPNFEHFIPLVLDAIIPISNKRFRDNARNEHEDIIKTDYEHATTSVIISYFLKNFIEAWNTEEEFKITKEFLLEYKLFGASTLPTVVIESIYAADWESANRDEE